MFSFLLVSLLPLYLAYLILRDVHHKRTSRLPPGPAGLPLLGNILDLPSHSIWLHLTHWSHTYGPMYTFRLMGQAYVVLSGVKVAGDILDRRSGLTAGRMRSLKGEFYWTNRQVSFKDYGLEWRADRRALHANLNIHVCTRFHPIQSSDSYYSALGLLHHPAKPFHAHAQRLAGSVVFRSLYGGPPFPHTGEDPSRRMEQLRKEMMLALQPQNSMVDMLPWLQPVVARVKLLRRAAESWVSEAKTEGKRLFGAADRDSAWETIVHDLEANGEKYGLTQEGAMWSTMAIYMAAQETTSTALRTMALALLHHPEAMETAQRQLDAVCGDRLPTFEDRENLPYIHAIIQETIRWKPGVPLSLFHKATEDFEYDAYVFPKGTVFIDNIWGQTHDPTVYANPDAFDPSRFLDASGKLLPATPDTRLDLLGFGHGRRVCPGKDFAVNSLFITCATLLWAFRLEWPVDQQGTQLICGVDEFEDHGLVAVPKEFGVVVTPRREGLEEQLTDALKV